MFEVNRLNKLLIVVKDKDNLSSNSSNFQNNVLPVGNFKENSQSKYFKSINLGNTRKSDAEMCVDCSNSFKDALDALKDGAKVIKLTDDYSAYFKVIDIANKYNAKILKKKKSNNFQKL